MLDLAILPTTARSKDEPSPGPAGLKAFLEGLPLGAPQQAIMPLTQTVTAYNHSELPPNVRFASAETFTSATRECAHALAEKYLHSDIPLVGQRYVWHEQVQQLYRQMAMAYEIVASELSVLPERSEPQNLLLCHAIRKAIIWLSRMVVNAYAAYLADPEGIWRDMHRLYAYAESLGMENLVLEKTEKKLSAMKTIQYVYQRIAMLSVASPYHLMPGEAQTIYTYLNQWAVGCRVVRPKESRVAAGTLLIDISGDHAPYFTHQAQDIDVQLTRGLDLTHLLTRFNDALSKYTKAGAQNLTFNERLHRNMLLRLYRAWKGREQRKTSRRPSNETVMLASGLSACHYFISGETDFLPEVDEIHYHRPEGLGSGLSLVPKEYEPWREEKEQSKIASGIEKARLSDFREEANIWNKIYASQSQGRMLREDMRQYFAKSQWEQFNITEEGMGLKCDDVAASRTRVGDVVCYRFDGEAWRLGEIRWMRDWRADGVTMGIMTLADQVKHVAVRAVAGAGSGGEYFRALSIVAPGGTEHLLTPAAIYDTGTRLVMNWGDRLVYVQLSKLVHTTSSFSRFEFQFIEIPSSEADLINAVRAS